MMDVWTVVGRLVGNSHVISWPTDRCDGILYATELKGLLGCHKPLFHI